MSSLGFLDAVSFFVFRVSGFVFRVSNPGFGFRVSGFEFRSWVWSVGFPAQVVGLGFGVSCSGGFGVWGFLLRGHRAEVVDKPGGLVDLVQGLGFRVQG